MHWSVRRIKTVLRETDLRSSDGSGTLLSLTRVRGLIPHSEMTNKMHSAKTLAGYKCYRPGQIVMNRMQAWSGMFGAGLIDGLISPDYAAFDVVGTHEIKFILERLKAPDLVGQFALESKGIGSGFNRLYTDRFGPIQISLPPPDEEVAIVRFLNHVNGRLERAIRAKRKELALISEMLLVVTDKALQQEGTRELRISAVAEVMSRPIDRRAGQNYTRIGLYNRGRGMFHKATVDGAELGDSDFFLVEDGDLVISGQFAWEGAVALARGKDSGCVASHRYPILRGRKEYISSAVLLALFRTPYGSMLLDHHSRGAAGRNRPLNERTFLKEKILIPPLSAQGHIVELLDQEYVVTQSLALTIRYINEYRTRLVADVVTGKLDVREAAKKLPAEAVPEAIEDDSDLIDEIEPDEQGEAT